MTFVSILSGAAIFLDANSFIYHFTNDSAYGPACTRLVKRVELRDLSGFTSAHVLADVAHRLMTLEASRLLGRPQTGMAYYLNKHHAEIQRLSGFRQAIVDLAAGSLQILTIPTALVVTAAALS